MEGLHKFGVHKWKLTGTMIGKLSMLFHCFQTLESYNLFDQFMEKADFKDAQLFLDEFRRGAKMMISSMLYKMFMVKRRARL
jgi:hypothetical protein